MSEPTTSEPLGFAIIGCGVIAPQHARALASLPGRARLLVSVDPVHDRAAAFAAEYGGRATTDLDEVLADPSVGAVSICTPTGLHAALAVRALGAGKHVVVEKPIDVDGAAADRLVAAAAASDRTVTVISQHRFDESSHRVHEAAVGGEFGRLTSGVASVSWWRSQDYYDSGDWRGTWALDGGGALMNQSVHTLDLLVWLLGDPVSVTAVRGLLAHERIEVEDTLVATVTFASGALGVVHATTAAYPGLSARLQILGSRGSAVIDDDQLVYLHIGSAGTDAPTRGADLTANQIEPVVPGPSKGYAGADPTALSDAHTLQYADFLDAIDTGRNPLVTVTEARRSLATILAIYDSARHGGRPTPIGSAEGSAVT
jgi:UDP-N-acetyl-2-amino-2-deoxyglucuronate dehydrogenase